MKTTIAYIVLSIMASIPTALIIWGLFVPLLPAIGMWFFGGLGLSIVLGGAWGLHWENKQKRKSIQ